MLLISLRTGLYSSAIFPQTDQRACSQASFSYAATSGTMVKRPLVGVCPAQVNFENVQKSS